jgi:hypothetical protein
MGIVTVGVGSSQAARAAKSSWLWNILQLVCLRTSKSMFHNVRDLGQESRRLQTENGCSAECNGNVKYL